MAFMSAINESISADLHESAGSDENQRDCDWNVLERAKVKKTSARNLHRHTLVDVFLTLGFCEAGGGLFTTCQVSGMSGRSSSAPGWTRNSSTSPLGLPQSISAQKLHTLKEMEWTVIIRTYLSYISRSTTINYAWRIGTEQWTLRTLKL